MFACFTYSSTTSNPAKRRLRERAAYPVVPLPIQGSTTKSFSAVVAFIYFSGRYSGCVAGWSSIRAETPPLIIFLGNAPNGLGVIRLFLRTYVFPFDRGLYS